MLFLKTLPPSIRNLNLWPPKPQKFMSLHSITVTVLLLSSQITSSAYYRETLESYSEDKRKERVSLGAFISMALEIKTHKEISRAYQGAYEVRMNLYPPCPKPERLIGLLPHADISGIALLLQCGDLPGLQALKDGQWVPVLPKDGATVVNLGHIPEIMSNGIYKALDHRAVVNRSKERQSIVTICYANSSFTIGPAKELTI